MRDLERVCQLAVRMQVGNILAGRQLANAGHDALNRTIGFSVSMRAPAHR